MLSLLFWEHKQLTSSAKELFLNQCREITSESGQETIEYQGLNLSTHRQCELQPSVISPWFYFYSFFSWFLEVFHIVSLSSSLNDFLHSDVDGLLFFFFYYILWLYDLAKTLFFFTFVKVFFHWYIYLVSIFITIAYNSFSDSLLRYIELQVFSVFSFLSIKGLLM